MPTGLCLYPASNYNGPDSFTYTITDGKIESSIMTASITVTAVNDAPIGLVKTYSATEDTTLAVSTASGVLSGATDVEGNTPLTAVLVSNGSKGVVTLNSDGSFSYAPNLNANGTDTFTYRIRDSLGALSGVMTATINIAAVNDAPVGAVKTYSATEDTALSVNTASGVLAGATDVEGNTPLTAQLVSNGSKGSVV